MADRRQETGLRLARRVRRVLGHAQILGEPVHVLIGLGQQPVLQEKQGDERDAANHQRRGNRREHPVQIKQPLLIAGGQIAGILVGGRRHPGQRALEPARQPQHRCGIARFVDLPHQRIEAGQQRAKGPDGFALFRPGLGKLHDVAVTEHLEAVVQDVEAKLHFIPVDAAVWDRIGRDPFLETIELADRLADRPHHVVPRHLLQRPLAIEDGERHADAGQREDDDAGGQRGLDDAEGVHRSTRCSRAGDADRLATGRSAAGTAISPRCGRPATPSGCNISAPSDPGRCRTDR